MAFKKIGSSIAAMAVAASGLTFNMGSAVAPAAAATAVGLGALLASAPAEAQSGKRVCALQFTTRSWGLAFWATLEVSKYDVVTCGASWGAFQAIMGVQSRLEWVGAALNSSTGGLIYNETCEKFSTRVGYNGDLCNSMQDYTLYGVLKRNNNYVGHRKVF